MEYPAIDIRFKYYGKHIELLVAATIEEKDKKKQESFLIHIAALMKGYYLEWNRESIDEKTLLQHIAILSDNKLTLDMEKVQKYSLLSNNRRERHIQQRKNNHSSQRQNNNKRNKRKKA